MLCIVLVQSSYFVLSDHQVSARRTTNTSPLNAFAVLSSLLPKLPLATKITQKQLATLKNMADDIVSKTESKWKEVLTKKKRILVSQSKGLNMAL